MKTSCPSFSTDLNFGSCSKLDFGSKEASLTYSFANILDLILESTPKPTGFDIPTEEMFCCTSSLVIKLVPVEGSRSTMALKADVLGTEVVLSSWCEDIAWVVEPGLLLSLAKHSFTVDSMIGSAADIHSVTKSFNTVSSSTAAGLVAVADGFVLRLFGREAIFLKTITFL